MSGHSTAPLRAVSLGDTAIDVVAMGSDLREYVRDRDYSRIKLVPGKTPTVFHVRRIDANTFSWVQQGASEYERFRRAFKVGIEQIDDIHTVTRGPIRMFQPSGTETSSTGMHVKTFTDEDMCEIAPIFVEEIGSVCWWRSFLPPGSEASYPPPPSLLAVLQMRFSQVAAEIGSELPSQKSEEQQEAAPTQSSTESDTGATATASATAV